MADVGGNILKEPFVCIRITCGHLFFFSKRGKVSS